MPRLKEGFIGERAIIIPSFINKEYRDDELGRQLHITDIGYYPRAKFHHMEREAHEANQFVLIYCINGSGWYSVRQMRHEVKRHQFFILPKREAHVYESDNLNPWTVYWIHFDGLLAPYFAAGFENPTSLEPGFDSRIEERLDLFEEIFKTLGNGYSVNNLNYTSSCLFHFLGSFKFLGVHRSNTELKIKTKNKEGIDVVIHFMRENIDRKMTLKEMADQIGMSVSHFSTMFQKGTGYSPIKYLNHLKIQKACHYLDFTDMKVNQICPKVGFEDPFYFTRTFTKIMSVSPSEYRSLEKG